MSDFNKNIEKLKVLSVCSTRERNRILKTSNKNLIKLVCECVDNTLIGNIDFDKRTLNQLTRYKNCLRKIKKAKSLKTKRNILVQKGGFLQYILPSAIAIITSLIQKYMNNKNGNVKKMDSVAI